MSGTWAVTAPRRDWSWRRGSATSAWRKTSGSAALWIQDRFLTIWTCGATAPPTIGPGGKAWLAPSSDSSGLGGENEQNRHHLRNGGHLSRGGGGENKRYEGERRHGGIRENRRRENGGAERLSRDH